MIKQVKAGDPLLPSLTAEWFNQTIRQQPPPGNPPERKGLGWGQLACTYLGEAVDQFGLVALHGTLNQIGQCDDVVNEKNWVVTQKALGVDDSSVCVINGLTWAKVHIRRSYHRYATWESGIGLVSSCYGKAELIAPNNDGSNLHLIMIGAGIPMTGIALTEDPIPAGTSIKPGQGSGALLEMNNADEYDVPAVPTSITLFNSQPQPTSIGIVHFKEWCGRAFVDVSPCGAFSTAPNPY